LIHLLERRSLTPEQWKARGEAIQARLQGLSIDELMRGSHGAGAPHLGAHGQRRGGGYDPNQPRVPAGHSDGGQWTDDDRWADRRARLRGALQLAASELPPFDPRRWGPYLARKVIEAIHRELAKWDLFGHHDPDDVTVTVTVVDGKVFHGTSSDFGDWKAIDHAEAYRLRAIMVRRFPHQATGRALGQWPLNALFHAETNLLLRVARENGGTLAGRTLDVFVDGRTCSGCRRVLGDVAQELGNPTLTFIDARTGQVIGVVRQGRWRPR